MFLQFFCVNNVCTLLYINNVRLSLYVNKNNLFLRWKTDMANLTCNIVLSHVPNIGKAIQTYLYHKPLNVLHGFSLLLTTYQSEVTLFLLRYNGPPFHRILLSLSPFWSPIFITSFGYTFISWFMSTLYAANLSQNAKLSDALGYLRGSSSL